MIKLNCKLHYLKMSWDDVKYLTLHEYLALPVRLNYVYLATAEQEYVLDVS